MYCTVLCCTVRHTTCMASLLYLYSLQSKLTFTDCPCRVLRFVRFAFCVCVVCFELCVVRCVLSVVRCVLCVVLRKIPQTRHLDTQHPYLTLTSTIPSLNPTSTFSRTQGGAGQHCDREGERETFLWKCTGDPLLDCCDTAPCYLWVQYSCLTALTCDDITIVM